MFQELSAFGLVVFFLSVLVSIGFHEAMHAFTAHWLGDSTAKYLGRLTLNPLAHIDLYTSVLLPLILVLLGLPPFLIAKPVPFNPARVKYDEFGAALIGISGPLTNLLLATVGASIIRLFGIAIGTDAFDVFAIFIQVNILLFVFNMIPFPPLDGSRLLYAFAPEPLQRVMQQIEGMGFMTILLFMLVIFPLLGLGNIIVSVADSIYMFLLG